MQRCSSHGNMLGPCSCGSPAGSSSFSFLFAPLPSKTPINETPADLLDPFASSSSLVDCTLSLGTPSTRQTETTISHHNRPLPSSSCMSNLCWDIFQPKQPSSFSSTSQKSGGGRSSGGGYSSSSSSARRCANCDTTSTPLWRNGPRGPKSLCNACGIRYKKEERRATSTSTDGGSQYSQQHMMMNHHHQQQWTFAAPPPPPQQQHRAPAPISPAFNTNEFRLIEDDNDDGDSSPFLSWRLSVPPPPDFPLQYT